MTSPRWRVLCGLAIGGVVGVLICSVVAAFDGLAVDGTVTMGNIIQSATTLIVALVVTSYLQTQAQSDRKERDLVLRFFDLSVDAIAELDAKVAGGNLSEIQATLKKLSSSCSAASDICTEVGLQTGDTNKAAISSLIVEVRQLATDTPIDEADSVRCGATVKNNVISLSKERSLLLETKVHQLRMRLLKAQMAVNRAHRLSST
jgi:hypothetical protein